ncbi:hypothetical protein WMF26_45360 [Sorangium sp. So ce185]|uniref:hypothetical protein n=1 Tax=Sorangium sp. So ce185 TaxID=3133287 RepID=UPI003F5FBE9B
MNLVLLVEGAETEPRVYEAWLRHRIPALHRVANVADLTADGYVLVSGKGYPSCYRRIAGLLKDIDANPGRVQELWICIDSEEDTYEARYAEVHRAVQAELQGSRMARTNPSLEIRIIIQHCCIETWFLGHDGFLRAGPQLPQLVDFKRFYDVSTDDPERMGKYPGYVTRASFHLAYLKAMLIERSHRYTKQRPGVVIEPSYFEALRARCARTGHLPSFRHLLTAFEAAGDAGP